MSDMSEPTVWDPKDTPPSGWSKMDAVVEAAADESDEPELVVEPVVEPEEPFGHEVGADPPVEAPPAS